MMAVCENICDHVCVCDDQVLVCVCFWRPGEVAYRRARMQHVVLYIR